MRIAVCDGDGLLCKSLLEQLHAGLRDTGELELVLCPDGAALLAEQEKSPFFCVFLELSAGRLPEDMALADALWRLDGSTRVVFLADRAELVFHALRLPLFHFIRKECLEQDLDAALQKLRSAILSRPRFYLFHAGGDLLRIPLEEVAYMESFQHTILIHCREGTIPASDTLTQLGDALRESGFVRIHKSYLVNLYHISAIRGLEVMLDDGGRLPVSRHRALEVRQRFENYIRHLEWLRDETGVSPRTQGPSS